VATEAGVPQLPPWPGPLALVRGQVRYQNKIFWRTPLAAFFTLVLPLMFLVLFSVIFGSDSTRDLPGVGRVTIAQFYAPSLAVFAATQASFANTAVTLAFRREQGLLKRSRGTPLPEWAYLSGTIVSAVWIALIATTVMMTAGWAVFDVEIDPARLPAAAVAFVLSVICFAGLGLAVLIIIPNGDAAPAVTNGLLLPLAFISNVFIPLDDPPPWVDTVGDVFPLKHAVQAFSAPFSPVPGISAWRWGDLAVVAVWGAAALVVGLRWFRWEPRRG
jgi:ABC-2 type transport system permease protein